MTDQKKPATKPKPRCVACGGTGKSSQGWPCFPCKGTGVRQ